MIILLFIVEWAPPFFLSFYSARNNRTEFCFFTSSRSNYFRIIIITTYHINDMKYGMDIQLFGV